MIALVVAIIISFSIASGAAPPGSDPVLYGIFGTALTAMAMLSLAGIVLSIDAFGPIADNAGGIVAMTGMGEENRKITDRLTPLETPPRQSPRDLQSQARRLPRWP